MRTGDVVRHPDHPNLLLFVLGTQDDGTVDCGGWDGWGTWQDWPLPARELTVFVPSHFPSPAGD